MISLSGKKQTELPVLSLYCRGKAALQAFEASTFSQRLWGLHRVDALSPHQVLVIRPCRAIHTLGLTYTIDVAFVDADGVVLRIGTVKPGRCLICRSARAVIEAREGVFHAMGIVAGDKISRGDGSWR